MKLSTYSWLVVVVAAAVAAIGWLGLAGWMAVVVLLASVAMHVAGNAIGTRLKDRTDIDLAVAGRPAAEAVIPEHTPGRLERKESLGLLVPVSATIGAFCGGAAGAAALVLIVKSSVAGSVLGGLSSAVIGGFLGFLLASAVAILRASLKDAIAAEDAGGRRKTGAGIASNGAIDLVRYEESDGSPRGGLPP